MDFGLSKKHEMARSLFKEFAENEVKPLAQEVDETEKFPTGTVEKMAKYGFLGIPVPKELPEQFLQHFKRIQFCPQIILFQRICPRLLVFLLILYYLFLKCKQGYLFFDRYPLYNPLFSIHPTPFLVGTERIHCYFLRCNLTIIILLLVYGFRKTQQPLPESAPTA